MISFDTFKRKCDSFKEIRLSMWNDSMTADRFLRDIERDRKDRCDHCSVFESKLDTWSVLRDNDESMKRWQVRDHESNLQILTKMSSDIRDHCRTMIWESRSDNVKLWVHVTCDVVILVDHNLVNIDREHDVCQSTSDIFVFRKNSMGIRTRNDCIFWPLNVVENWNLYKSYQSSTRSISNLSHFFWY